MSGHHLYDACMYTSQSVNGNSQNRYVCLNSLDYGSPFICGDGGIGTSAARIYVFTLLDGNTLLITVKTYNKRTKVLCICTTDILDFRAYFRELIIQDSSRCCSKHSSQPAFQPPCMGTPDLFPCPRRPGRLVIVVSFKGY